MRCRAMTVKCGLEMCVEMWLPGGLTWCWSIVHVRLISCPVSEPQLEIREESYSTEIADVVEGLEGRLVGSFTFGYIQI